MTFVIETAPRQESPVDLPAVNLNAYDLIVVNTSAGKDSQAMMDRLVRLADLQGCPRSKMVAVHADLGRVEWKGTAQLAQEQAEAYGLRFVKVSRLQGDLIDQIEARRVNLDAQGKLDAPAFPSSTARYCTSDQKRGQVARVLTAEVNRLGLDRPARVLNCMGIRSAESAARSKKTPFQRDKRASNGRREVDLWFPIFELTEAEVWEIIRRSGVPHHWAYDQGMPRLSCCFCVLAGEDALVRAAQLNPELAEDYRQLEIKVRGTIRKGLSMEQVIAKAQAAPEPVAVTPWEA